jgi:hypothetical protein
MHGEPQPGDDSLAGAGDAEFEDGGADIGEGRERGSSGVRRAADPVVNLFEQLRRRAVPQVEQPASDEPDGT